VVAAGCGRFGFGDAVPVDVAPDAAGADTVFFLAFDDDPSDGLIDDTSGHGFSATCVAGLTCPTQIAGKHGNGLQFNGTTQYALIQHQPALATSRLTVALWVYRDTPMTMVAVGKPVGAGSSDSWALVAWTDETCLETTNAGVAEWACAPVVLPTGTWFHLAGVWDGALKSVYINGSRAGSVAGTGIDVDMHDIVVGADQNSGSLAYPWQGRLDELRMYDRALTQPEITALAVP
jgi:hypothetical protein